MQSHATTPRSATGREIGGKRWRNNASHAVRLSEFVAVQDEPVLILDVASPTYRIDCIDNNLS